MLSLLRRTIAVLGMIAVSVVVRCGDDDDDDDKEDERRAQVIISASADEAVVLQGAVARALSPPAARRL